MTSLRNVPLILAIVVLVTVAGCADNPDDANRTSGTTPVSSTAMSPTQTGTSQISTGVVTDRPQENATKPPTNASVTFTNQVSNGSALTVANATLTEIGFIVIIDGCSVANDSSARAFGSSEPLDKGRHSQIPIALEIPVNGTQLLTAVVVSDTSGDRELDTDGSDEIAGANTSSPVRDTALVAVEPTEKTPMDGETTDIVDCTN